MHGIGFHRVLAARPWVSVEEKSRTGASWKHNLLKALPKSSIGTLEGLYQGPLRVL